MGALDIIARASLGEVEAGGIRWQIRAIRSEMVRDLRYHLLHVRIPSAEDMMEEASIATRPEADQAAAKAEMQIRRAREALTPERMADAATRDEQIVSAGVIAVWRADEGEAGAWEPVTITAAGTVANPSTQPPTMPADALPASIIGVLSTAIWALSTDGGDAAARIRSFRGGH